MSLLDIYALGTGINYAFNNNLTQNDIGILIPSIIASSIPLLNNYLGNLWLNEIKKFEDKNKSLYDVNKRKYINFKDLDFRLRNNLKEISSNLEKKLSNSQVSKDIILNGSLKMIETYLGYTIISYFYN